jgi:GDP-4-dehydro-6-deoxy-D-mannose reductase
MVMNAGQSAGVKGMLQVSSAEIYGDAPEHKIDENFPARPHSTYGASKLAIDMLVQSRWKEAKTPVIALRQFNCVGERETHEYIIPVIIDQIHKNMNDEREATIKLGNNSFRDFQYAGDAVKMATELLEKGEFGEVYNMGSEEGVKMFELAEIIGGLMEIKVKIEVDPARVRPWEIWHLQSDNTKLYSTIQTRPRISLEEALDKTISYYYENDAKWGF